MSGRVPLAVSPGGVSYPVTAVTSALAMAPNILSTSIPPALVLGATSVVRAVPLPALTATPTLIMCSVLLAGIPSLSLLAGSSGVVIPAVSLNGIPPGVIVGLPALTLLNGVATNGSTTWTLSGGRTYNGLTVRVVLPCYAPGGSTPAQNMSVNVQATVYGFAAA